MTVRRLILAFTFFLVAAPACAMDFGYDAYVDFRLIVPGNERSWLDGGLGKLRYDASDGRFQFAGGVVQGYGRLTPEVEAVAVVRADQEQKDFILPLESYVRYRPVSTNPWRWSAKIGAFFPPFSLENTELGWTSYWTITPSAINSWVGDELRTIGGEGTLEWRNGSGTLSLLGSAYGWNDPAGVLMADRGWALDDVPTALFDEPRRPDATLILFHAPFPDTTPTFMEIDHRVGWYGGATWDDSDGWRAQVFRYDNDADPAAHKSDYFAWHTNFWDAGLSKTWREFTFLVQGLSGTTVIQPSPTFVSTTNFSAIYALIGWEMDDWRLATRLDEFRTHTDPGSPLSEDGYAVTSSASWLPKEWLRLSAEILYVDSKRDERFLVGLNPRQVVIQGQLSARVYL
jgi:hypothetical protein